MLALSLGMALSLVLSVPALAPQLPGGIALAVEPDEMLSDPELEARARQISKGLRCLVCRNENIDDSNAKLAKDLRILVRERLAAGDTDEQVVAYVVDRYGEYVLLKPRFSASNLVLWAAGPVMLLLGLGLAWGYIRQRRRLAEAEASTPPQELTEEERQRLQDLLQG